MNPDDLEEVLRRLPLRRPPGVWREALLARARSASRPPAFATRLTRDGLTAWWERLLPPWTVPAGAMAIAILLLISQLPYVRSQRGLTAVVTESSPLEVVAAVRAYRAQLAALADPDSEPVETRAAPIVPGPPVKSRPRSQWSPADQDGPADGRVSGRA